MNRMSILKILMQNHSLMKKQTEILTSPIIITITMVIHTGHAGVILIITGTIPIITILILVTEGIIHLIMVGDFM